MLPRLAVLLCTFVAALAGSRPVSAVTVERGCPGPRIEADAAFREHYSDLLHHLRRELLARQQVDGCAAVELRFKKPVIVVAVSLPDGRAAARDVLRAEDVLPALQALLLIPEASQTAPTAAAPVEEKPRAAEAAATQREDARRSTSLPAGGRRETRQDRSVVLDRDPLAGEPGSGSTFGFELSLVGGARTGDGQLGYGGGVLSFVRIEHWLVGFQGRADAYRALQGSDPETALALGLLTGPRFDLGSVALDITAGPAVVMRGATFLTSEVTAAPGMSPPPSATPPPSRSDVGPLPRLLFGARLGFGPRSVLRTFMGIDAELGPTQSVDDAKDVAPSARMPRYTVGLSLGATVGTR